MPYSNNLIKDVFLWHMQNNAAIFNNLLKLKKMEALEIHNYQLR